MACSDLQSLRRRTVEIDYLHAHRHLPGSLSALPIIAEIYASMDLARDVFILSKGHACAAHYAVLEAYGYQPDVSKVHPERDPANGITMTAGSLGHGLPTAVGLAWAMKAMKGSAPYPCGQVHILLGDGECQEGTTYEALCLAARFELEDILHVHVDWNRFQGSERLLSFFGGLLQEIFPLKIWPTQKGAGVKMFEAHPEKSTHLVTEPEFHAIMEEIWFGQVTSNKSPSNQKSDSAPSLGT